MSFDNNALFRRNQVSELRDKTQENPNEVYASDRGCLLYTSPSPRDRTRSRMPSSA